jgi:hypothetical protein
MKNALLVLLGAVVLLCSFSIEHSHAQTSEKPFQVALFNPIQIYNEDKGIIILRFNLIYGRNVSVKGLDVGLVNHNTGGVSKGLQHGLVGLVEGDFVGWHDNAVNLVRGEFTGYQSGIYNSLDHGEAFQLGIFNKARDVSGLQLGLVNYTENMYGLQIGLVNIIRQKATLPFFPIVNWSF